MVEGFGRLILFLVAFMRALCGVHCKCVVRLLMTKDVEHYYCF